MAARARAYEPGERAPVHAGDVILTHSDYFFSRLIRFGQRIRYPDRFAWANHAALVITDDGELAEALGDGVVRTHIDKYDPRYYIHIATGEDMTRRDLRQVIYFVQRVLAARQSYGWLTIASVSLSLLTNSKLQFGRNATAICSGFVCEALRAAGYVWPKSAPFMIPADIARYFMNGEA